MPDRSKLVREVLENGLEVLLYPSFDAPVASFQVWYRVGSRNELPGITGASHWVEHMMFKGTPSVPGGELMLRVNQNGGELNAFTSYDFTAYHETLPADRIEMAVELEADRMTQLLIDPDEVASERTVILSERQGAFNNPSYVLWDETMGSAFRAHSYRHFVIGHEHDLKTMTRDDLYNHYRRFYAPNNAVVVATGAFDATTMLERIRQFFGGIQAVDGIRREVVVEPTQIAERRVVLHHPAPAPEVLMGFHVPGAGHGDVFALELLAAIFSGAGGRMGRSARLPRNLVATGKARSASANYMKGIDPFLFLLGASGLPDGDPEELDRLLIEQLDLVKTDGVSVIDLARAKKLLATAFHFHTESVSDQANGLGEAAMYGDAESFFTYPDDIANITVDDLKRVVATYFRTANRTVGYLYPSEPGSGGESVPSVAALRFGLAGVGATALQPFEREILENGLTLVGQPQPADPVVAVRIRIDSGSADDPADQLGVASLAAALLMRGSGSSSREEFEEACDDLGASIGISAGRQHTDISITCLADDLDASLDLVGHALYEPRFEPQQLELTRREAEASLKQAQDHTMSVADQAARELVYPDGHPLRHRTVGTLETITAITNEQVRAFHSRSVLQAPITAAIVGGYPDMSDLAERIAKRFGGKARSGTARTIAVAPFPDVTNRTKVVIAGKEQADVALAIPVPGVDNSAFHDLDVADTILGQYGLMGRIGERVRQKQGLAYYAFCSISPGKDQSIWFSRAGVDPSNVDKAITSILDVVKEVFENGFTQDELDGTRQLMTGRLALTLQTNAGIAALLLMIEEYDLGLDYLDRYPAQLATVTLESTQQALRDFVQPDVIQVAVAGP